MLDPAGKTIVVTGAASGLGRAVALQLAEQGATVVLAARRAEALQETAHGCRQAGGTAIVCVTDVTQEQDVERLLETALAVSGTIDVWINNAGVTLFAHLDQGPFEQHRRVIETNLFGSMHCARAILPVFRRQRHGVLINVGSALSKVGQPFVPSYVISKFALRGLSETLRVEVADYPNIHVCTFMPYAFDSQHFEAGANYIGKKAHAVQPVQRPTDVARALVGLVRRPRRELTVPRFIALGYWAHGLLPRFTERVLLRMLQRYHFENGRQAPTSGTLFDSHGQRAALVGTRAPITSPTRMVAWMAGQACMIGADQTLRAVTRAGGPLARSSLYLAARLLRGLSSEPSTHAPALTSGRA